MIYFDNAATTRPLDEIVNYAANLYIQSFANPSSLHGLGIKAEGKIISAAKSMADILRVKATELVYTSGGTESNNMAVLGALKQGGHIITSVSEHPSISELIRNLESRGVSCTWLPVNREGYIEPETLKNSIQPNTSLVTIHHINSETGAIQPIEELAALTKRLKPEIIFHSDGVQGFGKYKVNLKNIDMYSMSSHKIRGLRGTGALYVKKGTKLKPLLYGGSQQQGLRPGTENTAGIGAMAKACELAYISLKASEDYVLSLKKSMLGILDSIEGVQVNGCPNTDSAYILNLSFVGIKAEVLLHTLAQEEIYISTGSACSSKKKDQNILRAYGLHKERIESAVRFSFSPENTEQEVEACLDSLKKIVPMLRKR